MTAVTDPDDPEVARALREASPRIEALHDELLADYPALQRTHAISGMLIGHGLGSFVSDGMTNDEIVAYVLVVIAQIRQTLGQPGSRS